MSALKNAKWEAASQYFVLNGSGHGVKTDAYRYAFDCSRMKDKTVNNRAYELFGRGEIQGRVLELQEIAKKAAEDKFDVSVEWKQGILKEVAQRSMSHEEVTDNEGNGIGEYKFDGGTAVRAINELNKMAGDHAAVKTDNKHQGKLTLSQLAGMSIDE